MRQSIETPRLLLRRATEHDLDVYCRAIYGEPKVMSFLPGRSAVPMDAALPRARVNLLETWASDGFGPWIVIEKVTSAIVGHCGLRRWPGTDDIEVLYAFTPDVWGRGFATEAARCAVAEGFSRLGLERIIAGVMQDNAGSARVLTKLGMRFWKAEQFHDLELDMYHLHRRDWGVQP